MKRGAHIDWQYVIFAPLWLRHSIIAVISVLIWILIRYLLVIPLMEGNQQLQRQLEKVERQAEAYQQQWRALPENDLLKAQIQQAKSELQPYQSDNGAGFIHIITGYLSASGCQLMEIAAPSVSQQGMLTLYDWQLNVSADYFQFIELIRLINDGSGLVAVNRLILDGGQHLTINMTLRLYQLNQGAS
ncbi:hypothetical protein I2494_10125 [Budviciaceae bacterium BWR-B9]|uniref:Pilus assembly protein PilO n=1 Tax=Limnobaculum allomyrinae TaxID=2791986 RepID=A0ABS1IQS0_9GAMM|nr:MULTISPECIES: hypothetical protein [Limnobaculum]MBK5144069.1 hypothetical protein [Limnobaculum allomyrinae]MBV7691728.1 hypothetical protein [Limnobaculum sp. M2-1]